MEPNQPVKKGFRALLTPERVLGIVLLVAVLLSAAAARHWSPTYDESHHLEMGRRIVDDGDFSRFDNSKMPVSALNYLGWKLAWGSPKAHWFMARLPQLLWLAGMAIVVFLWTRKLVGAWPALGAASLVALDPNLMAHSSVVTTDAPCTFFVLLSTWLFWRALESPSRGRWLWAGGVVGLAQAAKFSAVFLAPILLLIGLGFLLAKREIRPFKGLGWFILAALLSLNMAYAFQGSFTQGKNIDWQSKTFSSLSENAIPLPVPRPWVEGIDWVKSDDDRGHGNVYVDGRMTPKGQKSYYLRATLRKFPLPLLILPLIGLWSLRKRGVGALPILLPPVFLFSWFSLAFNFQLGIRYILPVVPFLAIWAAHVRPRVLAAGIAWTFVSGLSWWPWGLSYFNESVPDRSQSWRYLGDSNLDWGQGQYATEKWLSENPAGIVDPETVVAGPMLITANALTGILGDPKSHQNYACLRERFSPEETIAGHLYFFNLSQSEIDTAGCGRP